MLRSYKEKRNFSRTPEPAGKDAKTSDKMLHFVVQKHQASHLHYDFRIELHGTLKSWAVPKGPSLNPADKRLAMMVEDHPYDYKDFEGIIPKGNYGAGEVIIWDEGVYSSVESADKKESERIITKGLSKGHISLLLYGTKLQGEFSLVKLKKNPDDNSWILIKKNDAYASEEKITDKNRSVVSGKSINDLQGKPEKKQIKQTEKNKQKFNKKIKPMLATLIDEPFDHPDWVFEVKWDGYRAIAEIQKNEAILYSRNHTSFTQHYPEIISELTKIPHDCIFDGEIVSLDAAGVPQFQWLQNYRDTPQGTLAYYIFDLIQFNGRDTTSLPLIERKNLLKKLLPTLSRLIISNHIPEHGTAFFNASITEGLEGIVAKKSDSLYRQGVRSNDWLKIKNLREQDAVIGGYTEPRGGRKNMGALLLGVYHNDDFIYIGHTGGGFNDALLAKIRTLLEPDIQSHPPFKNTPKTNAPAYWTKPKHVCRIRFSEWTEEGHMRQPIFIGFREDIEPHDVHRETSKKPENIFTTPPVKEKETLAVEGKKITLTNTSKILWPEDGYTKKDLINYYQHIAPVLLPYIHNRPQSLNRHPNGIHEESFFQKNAGEEIPGWIQRQPIKSGSEERIINYIVCNDLPTLLYLANLGCIELNVWNATINHLDNPDYVVIDLDPDNIPFSAVVQTALQVKEITDTMDAAAYCKTSGKTGLHIYIPWGTSYTHEQARQLAEILIRLVHRKLPKITTIERNPKKRGKGVYLDYLQNRRSQTMAAPYCIRPIPGALVSTPLTWDELTPELDPHAFTMTSIFKRLKEKGDIWKDLFSHTLTLSDALQKLDTYAKKER